MRRIPAKILRIYVPGREPRGGAPAPAQRPTAATIAYEIEHISSHRQRVWLRERDRDRRLPPPMDARGAAPPAAPPDRRRLAGALPAQGLPRAEAVLDRGPRHDGPDDRRDDRAVGAADGAREVIIGMAHRGRLNVLAHNLGRSYQTIFGEFEGTSTLEVVKAVTEIPQGGTGDVKYHHGHTRTYKLRDGGEILVNLEANPSHLEFVDPVVLGATRAAQTDRKGPQPRARPARRGADHAARRRGLPRPGRRRGDAEPPGPRRLQGRRRAAPRPEQPGRLHDRLRGLALDDVGLGPREGLRRPDHPRQRRRRRGVHLAPCAWRWPSAPSSATTS